MTETQKRLAEANGTTERVYGDLVNKYIRVEYSLSEELALLRQRDEKHDEYKRYNDYVEICKEKAKKEVYGG